MENQKFETKDITKKVIDQFISEFEDLATDPRWDYDPQVVEHVRQGKKIPHDRWAEQLLIKVGQDFRLNPDQIDELKKKIFE